MLSDRFTPVMGLLALAAIAAATPASSAFAIPRAPAPALESPLIAVQHPHRARPSRPGVRPAARPLARPMARPMRPAAVRPVRPMVVRPGVRPAHLRPVPVRPAPVVRYAPRYYGSWYRPYRWRPGGAIIAGAAIGFLSAAAVGTYYYTVPRPPRPDLCWYYTDASRLNGFWDFCP